MAEQELLSSIQLYNDQLSQVSGALESKSLGVVEKQQLEELQQNLMQLLELTLDQLQQQQSTPISSLEAPINNTSQSKTEEEIRLEQELALFKSEIDELDLSSDSEKNKEDSNGSKIQKSDDSEDSSLPSPPSVNQNADQSADEQLNATSLLKRNSSLYKSFSKSWSAKEVHQLEGCAVCAPYTEEWGGHTYHNAVVMSAGHSDLGSLDLNDPEVVVLFSQPTSIQMLPCRFFLSGVCRFNESCQYSHGVSVPVRLLKPYVAPDASSLKVGSRVLCRHMTASNTRDSAHLLWHPGVVDAILHEEEVVSVQCTPCSAVVECRLDQTVQLANDSPPDAQLLPSDAVEIKLRKDVGTEEEESATEAAATLDSPAEWLLGYQSSALGDWEKHTKGIGSKLLQLMGYVEGRGLGRQQQGRLDPVPAYLYPPGVSLDRCMELRERSGGEDVLQVEKRLKKEQLREERRIQREEATLAANTSVFDIINNQLGGPSSKKDQPSKGAGVVNVDKAHLKANSSKELNMKGYQLDQRSAQLEREIGRLTASMARQAPRDKDAAQSIQQRIEEKKSELAMTQRAQARVSSEQDSRRERKKYVVF